MVNWTLLAVEDNNHEGKTYICQFPAGDDGAGQVENSGSSRSE